MTRGTRFGLAIAALVFVVDQAMKYAVLGPLGLPEEGMRNELLPIFALSTTHNLGVSLGLLRATGELQRWGLVALTGAIAAGVLVWMTRERNRTDLFGLGLVLGGAIGNILDRVRLGYVVDYADLHFGEFRPFLVFNVADAAITIGVLILLARAVLVREKPAAPAGPNVESPHA